MILNHFFLFSFGFAILSVTYLSVYKQKTRVFWFLTCLSVLLVVGRISHQLATDLQTQWRHERQLLDEQMGDFTVRTLILTQRGLAKSVSDAESLSQTLDVSVLLQRKDVGKFASYLPETDSLIRAKHFDSCAVVGNSGALTGYSLGNEIDSHSHVIRFNYPPLQGYETDVGNKTSWIFTGGSTELQSNHHPFKRYSDYPKDIHLMLFPPSIEKMTNITHYFTLHDIPTLHFVSPFFVNLANRAFTSYLRALPGNYKRNAKGHDYRATSGWRGVLAALLMCNHTHVYGFGASKDGGHGHYYSTAKGIQLENVSHNYTLERHLMLDLARGKVSCSDLRPLNGFQCGSLSVEQKGVVELSSIWNANVGVKAGLGGGNVSAIAAAAEMLSRVQSNSARNRTVEWAIRKARQNNEKKFRQKALSYQKNAEQNCQVVHRADGDIWRCHFNTEKENLPSVQKARRRERRKPPKK